MRDPFKIDGPTCFSFSTGRSSAYALRRTLDANSPDVLRQWLRVITCNTGREDTASLAFGARVDGEWLRPLGLGITWLEYRFGAAFEVVTFDTLSRNGEPFEAVIAQRALFTGPLPNPRSRYCSSEMKTRTMKRYLRSIGWTEWDSFVGIRADEQRRVAKFRSNPSPDGGHETVRLPLADAGVTAHDVGAFWAQQPFDLELPNNNGKTMHGNCDLCFLKPAAQILALIAEKPERAIWWAKQEDACAKRLPPLLEPVLELDELSEVEFNAAVDAYEASGSSVDDVWGEDGPSRAFRRQKIGLDGKPMFRQRPNTGAVFRTDRPSYAEMARFAADQLDMFDPNEEAIACFCGD
jgi:3'-phosphoadenosine 5'-phosphosulfate sulfotransferase (PAPS reductase)/FAD synthetase